MSVFLSLAFKEILHLKKCFKVTNYLFPKMKQCYLNKYTFHHFDSIGY